MVWAVGPIANARAPNHTIISILFQGILRAATDEISDPIQPSLQQALFDADRILLQTVVQGFQPLPVVQRPIQGHQLIQKVVQISIVIDGRQIGRASCRERV